MPNLRPAVVVVPCNAGGLVVDVYGASRLPHVCMVVFYSVLLQPVRPLSVSTPVLPMNIAMLSIPIECGEENDGIAHVV